MTLYEQIAVVILIWALATILMAGVWKRLQP